MEALHWSDCRRSTAPSSATPCGRLPQTCSSDDCTWGVLAADGKKGGKFAYVEGSTKKLAEQFVTVNNLAIDEAPMTSSSTRMSARNHLVA